MITFEKYNFIPNHMAFRLSPSFTQEEIDLITIEGKKFGFNNFHNFLRSLTIREFAKFPMPTEIEEELKGEKRLYGISIYSDEVVFKLNYYASRLDITPQTLFKKIITDPIVFRLMQSQGEPPMNSQ